MRSVSVLWLALAMATARLISSRSAALNRVYHRIVCNSFLLGPPRIQVLR